MIYTPYLNLLIRFGPSRQGHLGNLLNFKTMNSAGPVEPKA